VTSRYITGDLVIPGNLMISARPDEMQSLRAVAAVEAAGRGGQADLTGTAQALLRDALMSKLAELGLRWNPSSGAVQRRASRAARPDGRAARLMKTDRTRPYVIAGLAVAVIVLLWGGYVRGWTWTGFRANDQLWEWLHLLLLPVAIGTLPLWIQHPEYMSRRRRIGYLTAGAAFAALVMAGYLVPLTWTGFAGNTLWNWLQLTVLPIAVVSARFLPALLHSLRENQTRAIICSLVAAAWALTVVGGYVWHWSWTGFQGNTLWDWLELFILPLLVPTVVLPTARRWVSRNTHGANQEADAKATGASNLADLVTRRRWSDAKRP
jgi:hypothetical protein